MIKTLYLKPAMLNGVAGFYFYKMKYYTSLGQIANKSQLLIFIEFLMLFNKSFRNSHSHLLYRGDNLNNLQTKLGIASHKVSVTQELLDRLFMIGEKGKSYFLENFLKDNRLEINDVGDNAFNYIFENLNSSTKSKNTATQSFLKNHVELMKFFSDKENKIVFLRKIKDATLKEKMEIRNYYLQLLHQLGAIQNKNKSLFVSSTSSYDIAKQFADTDDSKKIVIHTWRSSQSLNRTLIKFGIPRYKLRPYPFQREITLFGGILPHYIIGLEIVDDDVFYINPAIYQTDLEAKILSDGFIIDQHGFVDMLKKTNYGGYITTDGDNYQEASR